MDDLKIRNADVVGSAILLNDDDVALGGSVCAEDGCQLATIATAHSIRLLIETVAHFGLDGRQLVTDQWTNVDGVRAAESLSFDQRKGLIEIRSSFGGEKVKSRAFWALGVEDELDVDVLSGVHSSSAVFEAESQRDAGDGRDAVQQRTVARIQVDLLRVDVEGDVGGEELDDGSRAEVDDAIRFVGAHHKVRVLVAVYVQSAGQ